MKYLIVTTALILSSLFAKAENNSNAVPKKLTHKEASAECKKEGKMGKDLGTCIKEKTK